MDVVPFTDDANRQQSVSRYFYQLADVMSGVDSALRRSPDGNSQSGLLGPATGAQDMGYGSGGEVFIRGQSGQLGTLSTTTPNGANTAALPGPLAMLSNPLVLLGLAAVVWFLLRKA
jgi:hypothetical protein